MSSSQSGHDAPTATMSTTPSPASQGSGGKMARRALIAAGALAVCGGAAVATPYALQQATRYTEDQVRAAFEAGAANARQALLNDLKQLEANGEIISIDAALAAANLTKLAVKYIVGPVATVMATIGVGALTVLINALEFVLKGLSYIPNSSGVVQPLGQLHDLLTAWRLNLVLIPQALSDYVNWDIDSAEKYLIALQAKIQAEQSGTPGPTATSTPGY